MNVYSCNGKNIFIRWKMECSIQLGCRLVEWNIPSFTSWKYSDSIQQFMSALYDNSLCQLSMTLQAVVIYSSGTIKS